MRIAVLVNLCNFTQQSLGQGTSRHRRPHPAAHRAARPSSSATASPRDSLTTASMLPSFTQASTLGRHPTPSGELGLGARGRDLYFRIPE